MDKSESQVRDNRPDKAIRKLEPIEAGYKLAPVSIHMFFATDKIALK